MPVIDGNMSVEPVLENDVNTLDLSTPWVEYARKIYILFGQDPEISVIYDPDTITVKLYVNNGDKADAIAKILPAEKIIGNITIKVVVIPNNEEDTIVDIYRKAFNGNPIFSDIITTNSNPIAETFVHVMFEPEVVQFYNDQLNHPDGMATMLYEDVARDIFVSKPGVFFNTETGDDFIVWPD